MKPEELDEWAREGRWLILRPGEAYEQRLYLHGSLFMYVLDNGKWCVQYSAKAFGRNPAKSTVKAENVSLDRAVKEAEQFVAWSKKGRKKRG
jgi:hypothetical protein